MTKRKGDEKDDSERNESQRYPRLLEQLVTKDWTDGGELIFVNGAKPAEHSLELILLGRREVALTQHIAICANWLYAHLTKAKLRGKSVHLLDRWAATWVGHLQQRDRKSVV